MHQMFAIRQVYEKYLANGKMYSVFIHMEKAYDGSIGMVCDRC